MPTREQVQEFVSLVEGQKFLESLRSFYADEATAQENGDPPRVGLAALLAHETALLAQVKVDRCYAESFVVEGDRVAIHWIFENTLPGGMKIRLDEISYQEWKGGKIVRERFFYDPGQRRRALP
jgi:ketosteroid isomerase-like protein